MKRPLFSSALVCICLLVILFSCSSGDDSLEPISNQYKVDEAVFDINSDMYWKYSQIQGGIDEIRLLEPLPGEIGDDMIILKPVPGPANLDGIYTYSKTGAIGTYDLNFVHNIDSQGDFLWSTNGDLGETLEIRHVGSTKGQKLYRIILNDFTLNYGYWDYLAAKWVSMGQKSFQMSYEGIILIDEKDVLR